MGSLEVLCGIAIIILLIYYYLTSNYDYWKLRGIRGPRPLPIFGNFKDILLAKRYIGDFLVDIYQEYKNESMIGIFSRRQPALIIKSPELIKDVLIKEFSKFSHRGVVTRNKVNVELFHRNLICIVSKDLRRKL